MSQIRKIIYMILRGNRDANIKFSDVRQLMSYLGFHERIRGDHFIYTKRGVDEILNLQPNGDSAKPYQVKQVRRIIVKYGLGGDLDA